MPSYTYRCTQCSWSETRVMLILEMLEFEQHMDYFPHHERTGHGSCYGPIQRVYQPQNMFKFHEGVYEHCGPDPIRPQNMGDIERECEKHGLRSAYAEDFGKSVFKTGRSSRWI